MFINYGHPKENASNNWFELRNGSLGYPTNRTKSERFINQICKFSNWRGHSEWVEDYYNSINQQKFRTICIHHHYAPSLLLINKIIIKSWIWFRVPLRQMPRFVVMILERMDNQTRHHNLLITEKQKKLKKQLRWSNNWKWIRERERERINRIIPEIQVTGIMIMTKWWRLRGVAAELIIAERGWKQL